MRYLWQITIILLVSLMGELCSLLIPCPIPASIYGLALLLGLLMTRVLPLRSVRETADCLVDNMGVLFVPSIVGIIGVWREVRPLLLPLAVIWMVPTLLTMAVSGIVTQAVLRWGERTHA